MNAAPPHFVLFSEARLKGKDSSPEASGPQNYQGWRFTLAAIDGSSIISACDDEPDAQGQRLELLAVVRGLEALDQPSRVTLVTQSRYISRGICSGLDEWRENDWRWESYGKLAPIRHGDLWQRIDRAMQIHQVKCHTCSFDLLSAVAKTTCCRVETVENNSPSSSQIELEKADLSAA